MTQVIASAVLAATLPSALVERAPLAEALARVSKVVEKRSTIPILSHAMLRGTGSAVVVIGTDLDMTIRVPVAGAVDSRFAATGPAYMLAKVLKAQKSELVSITAAPGTTAPHPNGGQLVEAPRLHLDFEGPRSTLDGRDVSDWPDMAEKEFTHSFSLSVDVLRRVLEMTDFAISTEETRYYLNGVYMHRPEGSDVLRFVATDGHRLSRVEIPAPEGSFSMAGAIIPRNVVRVLLGELKRKALKNTGTVLISVSAVVGSGSQHCARVRFTLPGCVEIESKAIDGSFPDYMRVVPLGNTHRVTVEADKLADAVKAVLNLASDRGRAVKFSIFGTDGLGEIKCSVTNPDAGSSSQSVEAEAFGEDGADLDTDIGLNGSYVLDVLARIQGKAEIMLAANRPLAGGKANGVDAGAPLLFRAAGADDPAFGWLGVQMPMRV